MRVNYQPNRKEKNIIDKSSEKKEDFCGEWWKFRPEIGDRKFLENC